VNWTNPIDQSYLEREVLTKESVPHVVYVTWPEDTFYPHLMPVLESVAADADRDVTVVTAPVADTTPFCEKYQVLFIPTVFMFRRGILRGTLSGFLPLDKMREIIRDLTDPTSVETMAEQIEEARKALDRGAPPEEIAEILGHDE